MSAKSKVVHALLNLDHEDLDEVIVALDWEIQYTQQEIEFLQVVREAIVNRERAISAMRISRSEPPKPPTPEPVRRGPGRPRKSPAPATPPPAVIVPADDGTDREPQMHNGADLLARLSNVVRLHGPITVGDLTRKLHVDYGTLQRVLQADKRFEQKQTGWVLRMESC